MNASQLVVAVTSFVSILAAIIARTFDHRGFSRLIEASRNEMKAELLAEIGKGLAEISALRGEVGALRVGVLAQGERLERIEWQFEAISNLAPPGKGD
jgi:hypothetical protein